MIVILLINFFNPYAELVDELKIRGINLITFTSIQPFPQRIIRKNLSKIESKNLNKASKILIKRLKFLIKTDKNLKVCAGFKLIKDSLERIFPSGELYYILPYFDLHYMLITKFGKSREFPPKTWHYPPKVVNGDTIVDTVLGIDSYMSYIDLNFKSFRFLFGRTPLKVSQGLILSADDFPLDIFLLSYSHKFFRYSLIFAPLDPYPFETRYDLNRYLSFHRLEVKIFKDRLFLSANESIIFARQDALSAMVYFLPFSIYRLAEYNIHYGRGALGLKHYDDDLYWDFDFYLYLKNLKLWCDFLIDDVGFVTDPKHPFFEDIKEAGPVGYSMGIKIADPLIKNSLLKINYTRVNAWTYFHWIKANYYLYLSYPLGHKRKSDFDELKINFTKHLNYSSDLLLDFEFVRHGETNLTWESELPPRNGFLLGTTQKSLKISAGIQIFSKYLSAKINLGFYKVWNYRHQKNISKFFPSVEIYLSTYFSMTE